MLSTTALSSATSPPICKIKLKLKFRADFDPYLRGYEWCGDAEVEGEEEGEDGEQGVQVQHGHHLILAKACLPVKQERSY